MTDCLFCKILAGDVPCNEVATNSEAYAFRDINPQAPTHVLIIPRRHVSNCGEIQSGHAQMLESMFLLAQQVATQESVAKSGFRLVFNTGADALNSVDHLHMHLLGGRRLEWPPG